MSVYILGFEVTDKTKTALVGGKGANLGELTRIKGVHLPAGFCISTEAFKKIIRETPPVSDLLDQLSLLTVKDLEKITVLSSEIRKVIEGTSIPRGIYEEIIISLSALGEKNAFAVRSSATAEDLPTASFAGQQDTYLNIIGKEAILHHISKCWASLFTDRAIVYRMQNGFDHRKVYLSVVVQKMIFPETAGILVTADPVTSNRKILSIDAGFGLGEAMVSGLVNADLYKVRKGEIIEKKVSIKKLAIYPLRDGGTMEKEIEREKQTMQVLTDEQILQLELLGRKIEEHFGSPQDVEWCMADGIFYIVQSRPITTLFPIPAANDQENHVYVSVGHQQMMTDPIKPLGLSFFLLTTRAFMLTAGGRLFVDITQNLATPDGRKTLIDVLGKSDPLIRDVLINITGRGNFIKSLPDDPKETVPGKSNKTKSSADYQTLKEYDPAVVSDLIQNNQTSLGELKHTILTKSGSGLFDFILEDIEKLKKIMSDPQSFGVIMTGMNAASWINEKMQEWLGEKNAADALSQSLSNNITSEMGLALLDLADLFRPYPELANFLQNAKDDEFPDDLIRFHGGREIRDAIYAFLNKYGMRCAGEIDITRTRWAEKPSTLVPIILSNIKNTEVNDSHRRFEQGRQEALKKEQDLLSRLAELPDGEEKVGETKKMIGLIRNFSGYREYPKYAIVSRYFVYKQALLKEAEKLLQAGVIHEEEDVYYLSFEEFRALVSQDGSTKKPDYQLISKRKEEYKLFERLIPPRIMTSEGEAITGAYYKENLPAGAIAGLAVSSGVIEGRARIVSKIEDADLEDGDILVTSFTDPSWTPLFLSIKGLVTEVGGLMTHGAVIAREYGLPAVVGVENATRLIKDRQRIRVNGTDGYVEIL